MTVYKQDYDEAVRLAGPSRRNLGRLIARQAARRVAQEFLDSIDTIQFQNWDMKHNFRRLAERVAPDGFDC